MTEIPRNFDYIATFVYTSLLMLLCSGLFAFISFGTPLIWLLWLCCAPLLPVLLMPILTELIKHEAALSDSLNNKNLMPPSDENLISAVLRYARVKTVVHLGLLILFFGPILALPFWLTSFLLTTPLIWVLTLPILLVLFISALYVMISYIEISSSLDLLSTKERLASSKTLLAHAVQYSKVTREAVRSGRWNRFIGYAYPTQTYELIGILLDLGTDPTLLDEDGGYQIKPALIDFVKGELNKHGAKALLNDVINLLCKRGLNLLHRDNKDAILLVDLLRTQGIFEAAIDDTLLSMLQRQLEGGGSRSFNDRLIIDKRTLKALQAFPKSRGRVIEYMENNFRQLSPDEPDFDLGNIALMAAEESPDYTPSSAFKRAFNSAISREIQETRFLLPVIAQIAADYMCDITAMP